VYIEGHEKEAPQASSAVENGQGDYEGLNSRPKLPQWDPTLTQNKYGAIFASQMHF